MEAIKIDFSGSVLIQHKGLKVWVDVWEDQDEILADWNQYIFNLNDKEDLNKRKFQSRAENFDLATSIAIDFYEQNFNRLNKLI